MSSILARAKWLVMSVVLASASHAAAYRPPHNLVLPWKLSAQGAPAEASLLELTQGRGALFAVGSWEVGARPLVIVHGINADFAEVQPLIDHFRYVPDRQVLVYAYDDVDRFTEDNGIDLGHELGELRRRYPWFDHVDIVGHSMGGVIVRRALNELVAGRNQGIAAFKDIHFVAVDTPWHGYPGPGWRLPFFRGAMDLQASSALFTGHPGVTDAASRRGLFGIPLPSKIRVRLVSADNVAAGGKRDVILDYTDTAPDLFGADLAHLVDAIRRYVRAAPGETRNGAWAKSVDQYAVNYLWALTSDVSWPKIETQLRNLEHRHQLEPGRITRVLERNLPRYAGDHQNVLGNADLLRDLDTFLR